MQVNRRLYRCRHDRRIAGVAAGLAEFYGLDPTLMRVLWFLSILVTGGLSILLYIALVIIVPLEPVTAEEAALVAAGGSPVEGHLHTSRGVGSGRGTMFLGAVLILFGALALVDALLPTWTDSWRYLWPAFLVGVGTLLIAWAVRRGEPDQPDQPDRPGQLVQSEQPEA
jgi:phage shock protein C